MAFNINNFLNAESKKEINNDWKPVKISIHNLRPAPDKTNFYHIDDKEIKDLAESIELIGLQQYPVVRPAGEDYEVIAGHKRRLALLRLAGEGKTEYEMVPCKIETPDDIQNELILIFTNSTQRERTDYEKMREIERVRALLEEYQKTHKLSGRKQDIIAGILGTSKTKVGTLDNINNNLIEPFKDEFAAGKISTSTANEIAGLVPEAQQALHDTYEETGALTAREARGLKESSPCAERFEKDECAKETGIKPEGAAGEVPEHREGQQAEEKDTSEHRERRQETPARNKTTESTPEQGEAQEAAQGGSEAAGDVPVDDLKYLARLKTKELASLSDYLTNAEIDLVQEIISHCRRRALNKGQQS